MNYPRNTLMNKQSGFMSDNVHYVYAPSCMSKASVIARSNASSSSTVALGSTISKPVQESKGEGWGPPAPWPTHGVYSHHTFFRISDSLVLA